MSDKQSVTDWFIGGLGMLAFIAWGYLGVLTYMEAVVVLLTLMLATLLGIRAGVRFDDG